MGEHSEGKALNKKVKGVKFKMARIRKEYKMTEKNVEYIEEVKEILTTAICDFLKVVRNSNPTAQIIWGYGMLGDNFLSAIREAVEGYAKQTADSRIHFLQFPDTTPDTVGSRLHPGVKAHQITAKEIETYLQELL